GTFIQYRVDILDGAAASEIVDHVIHEFEEFGGQLAHRHFGFLAEIDQLAFDAITRGAPLIFLDERAAIQTETHVAGVQAMQLNDDRLSERGDGYRFLDLGGDIAYTKLQGAERGLWADGRSDCLAFVGRG